MTGVENCGDGKTLGSEETLTDFCDDGGNINSDGCSSACTVDCGHTCTGGDAETHDTCSTECGDGKRAGTEACDDKDS